MKRGLNPWATVLVLALAAVSCSTNDKTNSNNAQEPDAAQPVVCNGNCHYVRAGAAGNNDGSDWTHAWTELPETLERGHVYYVADGDYPYYKFDDVEEAGRLIQILKATVSDHGTVQGWDDAYGDGQAGWTEGIMFSRGDYVFDGRTGGGPRSWTSGYGFVMPSFEGTKILIGDKWASSEYIYDVSNVVIRHVEMAGEYPGVPGRSRGIDATASGSHKSEIVVSHCYIHDESLPFYFIDATHVLFEFNYIARNASDAESHSEGISCRECNDVVYRYNWWEDIEGTGIIMHMSGTVSHWEVYGNVFYQSDDPNAGGVGHGVVADNASVVHDVKVYNNTVVGVQGNAGVRFLQGGRDHVAYNNLWVNIEWMSFDNVDADHNCFINVHFPHAFEAGAHDCPTEQRSDGWYAILTDDPFVDSANLDFHLSAPVAGYPGILLDAPFNFDAEGFERGADGVWDRGAYEFVQ